VPLLTLDAVILRSQHYRESSRIVTFYSREEGLVKGIARGARGKKGRFSSTLEPLQRVRVSLSVKTGRELQTVTQADLLHPFARIREDLFRSTYAQAMLELTGKLMWREHSSEEAYDLLLKVLLACEEQVGDPQLLFFAFQIHMATVLGYAIYLDKCVHCAGSLEDAVNFSLQGGTAFCGGCYPEEGLAVSISAEAVELINRLGTADAVAAAAVLRPARDLRHKTGRLLQRYLEYHTETDLNLRALRLAESLNNYNSEKLSSSGVKGEGKQGV
jgi:DNA repair protein RecO (recombination protein O)